MTDIKYHPLVDTNMAGTDKTPMFGNTDYGCVNDHHDLYLEEFIPNRYRLHARQPHSMTDYLRYTIHCPYCGAVMDSIAPHLDRHTLAVYTCKNCY